MDLDNWANKWNVSTEALEDLRLMFVREERRQSELSFDISEAEVLTLVRLEASKKNCRLWRNNVGAAYTKNGDFIRYGLANESGKMNGYIKSADLIGIKPVKITDEMVGKTIGQFISREIKAKGWNYTGTDRERAQLRWIEVISGMGGNACFATSEGTL